MKTVTSIRRISTLCVFITYFNCVAALPLAGNAGKLELRSSLAADTEGKFQFINF